jgi:hypothetical protein
VKLSPCAEAKHGGMAAAKVFTSFTTAAGSGLGYAQRRGHYAPSVQHQLHGPPWVPRAPPRAALASWWHGGRVHRGESRDGGWRGTRSGMGIGLLGGAEAASTTETRWAVGAEHKIKDMDRVLAVV